jgi:Flp pilus assembly protein TadD
MLKRILIVLSISVVAVLALEPVQSVHGILLTDSEVRQLDAADNSTSDLSSSQDGSGNKFVRALRAPFKAIGRLFGRGKKENKLERLTEKDVKNFDSARVTRIEDAISVPATAAPPTNLSGSEHLEQGRVLLNEGNLNDAIAHLSLAVSQDPNLAEAHNLLGVAFESKGLSDIAEQSFMTALKLDKKNPEILNNLGFLLYRHGDYKRALEQLKKAARLAPDNSRILNNLAMTQSQLGKYDDAYKNIVRAEGEIKGRINMANRLEVAGRKEEALKQFEAARVQAEVEAKSNTKVEPITVVMEIKNGFVTYASVSNPRPGMSAYENTALRIARQRRFPSNKNGKESVVIKISPIPTS